MKTLKRLSAALAISATFAATPAHAGIPTVDVAAIAADVIFWGQQFKAMSDQLTEARNQYDQLKENYNEAKKTADALKGGRGMASLLSDISGRQSVAADFDVLITNLRKVGATGASAQAKSIYDSIKSFDCTAQFPKGGDARKQCEGRALMVPTMLANLNESLARSKARASQLQQLVASVDTTDMKAAADLQARIGAEIALLNNEAIIAANAREQLRAQAELNLQAAREEGQKRLTVGQGTNPFGK